MPRKASPDNKCAHCREVKILFGRGLCHICFYLPGIRQKYRPKKTDLEMTVYDIDNHPLPSVPTQHRPATRKKILVLIERAARGEQLFHPLDAKPDLD